MIGSETMIAKAALYGGLLMLFVLAWSPRSAYAQSGLRLEKAGTDRAYFTHNGKPLLSFGGQGDFMFYLAEDAYDYKHWANWAEAPGIGHIELPNFIP